jgi:hypothetical protein
MNIGQTEYETISKDVEKVNEYTWSHPTSLSENKKTVMICDDERDVLQVFELALESKIQHNFGKFW